MSVSHKKSGIIFLSKIKIGSSSWLFIIASINHLLSNVLKSCLNQNIDFLYILFYKVINGRESYLLLNYYNLFV